MTSNIRYKSRIPVKTGELWKDTRMCLQPSVVFFLWGINEMIASYFCLPGRRSASLHLRLLLTHPVMANRGKRGGKIKKNILFLNAFIMFLSAVENASSV